jgi:phosphatidylinositol alpha-mannosyltransferase
MSTVAKPSLKIGFVLDDSLDKADGVQQYVLGLGTWFSAEGHDVHYLVGQTKRQDLAGIHSLSRNMGVRFNHNAMSMPLPASLSRIKQLLAEEEFDVLHVQIPYSPWLAHRIINNAGNKTVIFGTFQIVAHSGLVMQATKALALWTKSSLRRFDEIVSVSSAAARYAHATYGITTEVIPNVVDYQRFSEAVPLADYDDDVVTILFLGRLVARKGCLQLLKAVAQLVESKAVLPKFRILICGKGALEAKLRSYVSAHKLDSLVSFVGFVSENMKPRYYASADIAVFPSTGGESFGIVLAEALSSGRSAVLAGDNSGYRTVMEPRPDLLFDPYDINELASKLEELIKSSSARADAADWGKEYAQQFDTGVVGKHLLKKYNQALHKRLSA